MNNIYLYKICFSDMKELNTLLRHLRGFDTFSSIIASIKLSSIISSPMCVSHIKTMHMIYFPHGLPKKILLKGLFDE